MAINAPVQGTAADLMRIAMIDVYQYLEKEKKGEDVRMLLQVHDELVFEVKTEKLEAERKKLAEIMEGVMHEKENFGVPIRVGVSVGKNWGELESIEGE
jgi:DNA polymerase-1